MSDCCDPIPYRRMFNTKEANRRLANYRRRGLDTMARTIVDYLATQDLTDLDVLEVGGGVGDIQVELLKAGAGQALNVELSDAYENAANDLADKNGLTGRIVQQFGDFVEIQDDIDPAGIVVLNRVVCCYPFMERMMGAAVAKTERFLGLVFPRDRWAARMAVKAGNGFLAMRRCDFRTFVHPVDEIEAMATNAGLKVRHRGRNLAWQSVVFERVA